MRTRSSNSSLSLLKTDFPDSRISETCNEVNLDAKAYPVNARLGNTHIIASNGKTNDLFMTGLKA